MIAALALLITAAMPQEAAQKSIWAELGVKRTGNNGYEEYLDALDLYRTGDVAKAVNARYYTKDRPESVLELCRNIETKAEPVIAKIRAGNQKTVFDPLPGFEFEESDPRVRMPIQFCLVIQATAYSKFARGATSAAVDDLVAGIQFCDSYGRSTLTEGLMGQACMMIVIEVVNKHLDQLSLPDAKRMERVADQCLALPNSLIAIIRDDEESSSKFLREKFAKMTIAEVTEHFSYRDGGLIEDKEVFINHWESLTKEQRARAIENVAREIDRRTDLTVSMLSKPEKEWKASPIGKFNETERLLFDAFHGELLDFEMETWAKHRTKLRLLRLHAIIRQFRFEHDRLPKSLAELAKPKEISDPLTGEFFSYEPKTDLRYELFSKGNDSTGRIYLVDRFEGHGGGYVDPDAPPR